MDADAGPAAGSVLPTDDEVIAAAKDLRSSHPSLGIAKFHPLLLSSHPSWSLSEKRLRKLLQREGLSVAAPPSKKPGAKLSSDSDLEYPKSKLNLRLNIEECTDKVRVAEFGPVKGKGLVAIEKVEKDEVVWEEDPIFMWPIKEILDLQLGSKACGHCTRTVVSTRLVHCEGFPTCPMVYCNRLCNVRAAPAHSLLCPQSNPGSIPLMQQIRKDDWKSLGAWAVTIATVLGHWVKAGKTGGNATDKARAQQEVDDAIETIRSLSGLPLPARLKSFPIETKEETDSLTEMWKHCYQLILQAFKDPPNNAHKNALKRVLRKPIPEELDQEFLSWDAFLLGMGKMSLNMESTGGIYVLHSHLNHSCTPNIRVRHLDATQFSHISLVVHTSIQSGEELLVSYVDPNLDVLARRRELRAWGFGDCGCSRCVEEMNPVKENEKENETEQQSGESGEMKVDKVELEDELRGFLGI